MKLLVPEGACPPAARQALCAVYEGERLPHALILEGPQALTLPLAKQLAQAAVCTAADARPCGHCAACRKAIAGSHPDITIAGGAGGAQSFHKEDIAAVRGDAFIRPNEAACRVFLLTNAQDMTPQAQNALLKVLEEPPATVQFLLTCDRASALLPTVRSRAPCIPLGQEALPEDGGAAAAMAQALCSTRGSALLYASAPLSRDRALLRAALQRLAAILRDALVLRSGGAALVDPQLAARLAHSLTRERLYRCLQVLRQAQDAANRNAHTGLLSTTLCARLRAAAGK